MFAFLVFICIYSCYGSVEPWMVVFKSFIDLCLDQIFFF